MESYPVSTGRVTWVFRRVLFQPMHYRPIVEVYVFFEDEVLKEPCLMSD